MENADGILEHNPGTGRACSNDHPEQPIAPDPHGDRLEPWASRVEPVKRCIVHLLSGRLNGGFRLDVVSTRFRARLIKRPLWGYTREAAIRPNKHHRTGNDCIVCPYSPETSAIARN